PPATRFDEHDLDAVLARVDERLRLDGDVTLRVAPDADARRRQRDPLDAINALDALHGLVDLRLEDRAPERPALARAAALGGQLLRGVVGEARPVERDGLRARDPEARRRAREVLVVVGGDGLEPRLESGARARLCLGERLARRAARGARLTDAERPEALGEFRHVRLV